MHKPKTKQRSISVDEVIDNLYESDSSGDESWIELLVNQIEKYKNWELVKLDPQETDSLLPQDEEMAIEYSKLPVKSMPPIVVIPKDRNDRRKHRYAIVDGTHRAWAARIKGRKILAYRPIE